MGELTSMTLVMNMPSDGGAMLASLSASLFISSCSCRASSSSLRNMSSRSSRRTFRAMAASGEELTGLETPVVYMK
jgi:hypothetical protein